MKEEATLVGDTVILGQASASITQKICHNVIARSIPVLCLELARRVAWFLPSRRLSVEELTIMKEPNCGFKGQF